MKKVMVGMVAALVLAAGCATQGRIKILSLDFRKNPAQIEAARAEAEAPFKNWDTCTTNAPAVTEPKAKTEAVPVGVWTALFEMFTKLEANWCLVVIEWRDTKK